MTAFPTCVALGFSPAFFAPLKGFSTNSYIEPL
jgi:hypothetical protein